jgi:chaperone BCS1
MDVWVNFTNATKWQAESIFKRFFSSAPPVPTPNEARAMPMDAFANESPTSIRGASAHGGPTFNEAEISQLAKRFADAIPEGKMSVWPSIPTQIVSALKDNVYRLLV